MERPVLTETKLLVSGIGGLLMTTDKQLATDLSQTHDISYNNTSVVTRKYLIQEEPHQPQYYIFNFPQESYELFEHGRQAADTTKVVDPETTDANPTEVYREGLRDFRLSALRTLAEEQSPHGLGAYHEYYSYQWLDDLVERNDLHALADIEKYLEARPNAHAERWYADMRTYMAQERDANLIDYFLFQIGKHATGQQRIDHDHEQQLRKKWPFYQTNANNA